MGDQFQTAGLGELAARTEHCNNLYTCAVKFYRNTKEGVRGQVIVFGNNDEFHTVLALS